MGSIAILTDSTVQFTVPSFTGRNLVKVIPLNIQYNDAHHEAGKNIKPGDLPASIHEDHSIAVLPPPLEQLCTLFSVDENGQPYDQLLGIFTSAAMCGMVERALEAQKLVNGRIRLQIVDSETISVGLGILVQAAADAASRGTPLAEIERLVRSLIPHIYAVLCTPGLSYLHASGFLDRGQSGVGEMLGLYPIFAIEEGRLTSLEKLRNHRQVLDFFQEFLEEFDQLQYIAFLQSALGGNAQDGRILRDHAQDHFAKTPFSEHTINLSAAAIFGPNALSMFVVEPGARRGG
jgi:DegV family protein with EDD domain